MERDKRLWTAKLRLDLIDAELDEVRALDPGDEELRLAQRWIRRQRERVAAAHLDALVEAAERDDEARRTIVRS